MYTSMIEVASVLLSAGCAWHASRYKGPAFAQQWLVAGYLFGILRETVMQVAFPNYFYAPAILRLGAAPALVCLLYASLFYLAYIFSQRLAPPSETVPFAVLVFVITASLVLPIQSTGVQLGWWHYEEPGPVVFDIPLTVPLVWGGAAALFYLLFDRVSRTRLPERGRTYAMISFTPILAALHVVYTFLVSLVL